MNIVYMIIGEYIYIISIRLKIKHISRQRLKLQKAPESGFVGGTHEIYTTEN